MFLAWHTLHLAIWSLVWWAQLLLALPLRLMFLKYKNSYTSLQRPCSSMILSFFSFMFLKYVSFSLFLSLKPQVPYLFPAPLLPSFASQTAELMTPSLSLPLCKSLLSPSSVFLYIPSLLAALSYWRAGSLAHLSLCLHHLAKCLTHCSHLVNVD